MGIRARVNVFRSASFSSFVLVFETCLEIKNEDEDDNECAIRILAVAILERAVVDRHELGDQHLGLRGGESGKKEKHPTSNVQRPTSNVQRPKDHRRAAVSLDVRRWMLVVGCLRFVIRMGGQPCCPSLLIASWRCGNAATTIRAIWLQSRRDVMFIAMRLLLISAPAERNVSR